MRLLRLDLKAFGPFTDAAIDFPADGPGLHLIQGPNEAGKSSTLRALRALLFGFPRSITEDFRHTGAKLRVGATIRSGDGATLSFVRRRGNAKTVRAADDEAVVDPAEFDRFLGGVNADRFASLYSTDLDELVQGGKSIIENKGEFGPILFGGSGLKAMPQVLRELRGEAEKLYKPRASVPAINAALAELKTARGAVSEAMLSTETWRKLRDDRDAAAALRDRTRADLGRAEADRHRLNRLSEAAPALKHRDQIRADLDAIGPVPALGDDFSNRLVEANAHRKGAIAQASACRDAIRDLEAKLATIDVPDRLLAESAAIETLLESLGDARKAREARPSLLQKIARDEAEAAAILGRIAPGAPLDTAAPPRPTKPQRDAVARLSREWKAIEKENDAARRTVAEIESKLAARPVAALDEAADRALDELEQAIARIKGRGDLDAAAKDAEAKLRKLETKANAEVARLPLWSGSLDALAIAPMPRPESIDRYDAEFARAQKPVDALEKERKEAEARLADVNRAIDEANLLGDLPTLDDLDAARLDRAATWTAVKQAWLDGRPAEEPPRSLAETFEGRVATADDRADGLRREAARVTHRDSLIVQRKSLAARLEAIPAEIHEADLRRARVESEWHAAWRPSGIEPTVPAEMRGWLNRYDALVAQATAIGEARVDLERAADRRDSSRDELGSILRALGEPPPHAESLGAWIARAEEVLARGRLGRELAVKREEAIETAARLAAWRSGWTRAVAPMGLGPDATLDEASDAIDRIESLAKLIDGLRADRDRLAEIDRDADRLAREVRDLTRRIGDPDAPDDRTPDEILHALRDRLARARAARQDRDATAAGLKSQRDLLGANEASAAHQSTLIDELRRLAGAESDDDLPALIDAAGRAKGLRRELQADESRLFALAGNGSIDDLARDVSTLDPDTLPARLRDLDEAIDRLKAELDAQNQTLGGLQTQLNQMDGGAKAADANDRARQCLAIIESEVEQYVRYRLAEAVLRRAIEVYRERNQGPVLNRTSSLFADLTLGSFAGVRLDDGEDHDAKPTLKGLRIDPVRELVPVEAMSEGTANALFLAVRLATLESHLDAAEPMPFVVDDVLVHFDDARSAAALAALARLSRKTQVLFFTHHDHLVGLAREHLAASEWSLHRLPGRD